MKGMQGAEDEDSWMRDGADVLERELAARQTEQEASASGKPLKTDFDPEDMAERMKVRHMCEQHPQSTACTTYSQTGLYTSICPKENCHVRQELAPN